MSDRWVFLTAFLTVVLIVSGAFAVPEYFSFELLKSLIFVAIAVMAFFGEDRYCYMLGIVAPVLSFMLNILVGGFFHELGVLWDSITSKSMPLVDTPLHGSAILSAALLFVLCIRAWRKQVPDKFFGKAFGISLAVCLVHVGILAGWLFTTAFPALGRMP